MPVLNVKKRQPIAAFWYSVLGPLVLSLIAFVLITFFAAAFFADSCTEDSCALIGSGSIGLLIVVLAIALGYPLLYYLLFTYELSDRTITVNSGVIFRQYETIDFKKVQTIDNERNPLMMLFGLTRVEIWTASADQLGSGLGKEAVRIKPRPDTQFLIKKDEASALRDFVMGARQ